MIFKCSDGQWIKANCFCIGLWDQEQNAKRRSLFKKGIFRVEKADSQQYHLMVQDWSVCAWYEGNIRRARHAIDIAFSTYQGLTRKEY